MVSIFGLQAVINITSALKRNTYQRNDTSINKLWRIIYGIKCSILIGFLLSHTRDNKIEHEMKKRF